MKSLMPLMLLTFAMVFANCSKEDVPKESIFVDKSEVVNNSHGLSSNISFDQGMVVFENYEDFETIFTLKEENKINELRDKIDSKISTFNRGLNEFYDKEEDYDLVGEENFEDYFFFNSTQEERYEPIIVENSILAYILNQNRECVIGSDIVRFNEKNIVYTSKKDKSVKIYPRVIVTSYSNGRDASCDCTMWYGERRKLTGQIRSVENGGQYGVTYSITHKLISEKKSRFFGRWAGTNAQELEFSGVVRLMDTSIWQAWGWDSYAYGTNVKRISRTVGYSSFGKGSFFLDDTIVNEHKCDFNGIVDGIQKYCDIPQCGI